MVEEHRLHGKLAEEYLWSFCPTLEISSLSVLYPYISSSCLYIRRLSARSPDIDAPSHLFFLSVRPRSVDRTRNFAQAIVYMSVLIHER